MTPLQASSLQPPPLTGYGLHQEEEGSCWSGAQSKAHPAMSSVCWVRDDLSKSHDKTQKVLVPLKKRAGGRGGGGKRLFKGSCVGNLHRHPLGLLVMGGGAARGGEVWRYLENPI